jgi:hypothetical protein
LAVLANPDYHFKRIGLEAGPLSQWLYSALAEAGLPVICVETRHMRAVLQAQINKTDRNDARGIAQMMRAGLYRPVHVKTLRSQKLRMLLTHRKLLQSKAIAIDNDLRGTLRNFGLKVGIVGAVKFETRIKELVENLPDLAILVEPLLLLFGPLLVQPVIQYYANVGECAARFRFWIQNKGGVLRRNRKFGSRAGSMCGRPSAIARYLPSSVRLTCNLRQWLHESAGSDFLKVPRDDLVAHSDALEHGDVLRIGRAERHRPALHLIAFADDVKILAHLA